MVDIFHDCADNVLLHESEGRQGLAELARYQNARSAGIAIPEQSLVYLDLVAETLLTASKGKTGDMRAAIQGPRLGLTYPKSSRPEEADQLLNDRPIKKKRAFKAALYRMKLVATGVSPTDADESARVQFEYSDARPIRAACKKYKQLLEYETNMELLRHVVGDRPSD